ncbi:MAG: TetR/AcrR family transcriptional regulator [Pseudomonadota bacterium]
MSQLKQDLVDESLKFLTQGELKDLSLRRIASGIGVTHQAPYHHFKNKNELLSEIQRQAYHQLALRYHEILITEDDPFRGFQRVGIEYINLFIGSPGYFKVIANGPLRLDSKHNEQKQCVEIMDTIIRRLCQVSSRKIDKDKLKMTCWSCAHGFCSLFLSGQVKIPKKDLQNFIEENTLFLTELVQ